MRGGRGGGDAGKEATPTRSWFPAVHCLLSLTAYALKHPPASPSWPLSLPPKTEAGDTERLEIPKEAQEEMKQAKGAMFEMSKEPEW